MVNNIIGDKIQVETIKHDSEYRSRFKIIKDLNEVNRVEILFAESSEHWPFVYVVSKDGEHLKVARLNENKIAVLENLTQSDIEHGIIQVPYFENNTPEIPLADVIGKSIEAILTEYMLIENERVVFNIKTESNSIETCAPQFIDRKVKRNHIIWGKLRVVLTRWPWKWDFKKADPCHDSEPTVFVKQ